MDDDGNGTIDDSFGCWRAIYRFQNAAGARCLGPTTSAPPQCTGYSFEREAFIVGVSPGPSTYRAVQCSRGTDHIVVESGSSDHSALSSAGYDCTLELGYIFRSSPSGRTPFSNACPLWRFRYTAGGTGAHLFTRGADSLAGMTCEPPSRGVVVTNDSCFGGTPSGC